MDHYYVNTNAQSTGEHEVHKKGCSYFPDAPLYLGYFADCKEAITEAKEHYSNVDGCYYCCLECHTR